jgi:uncharacterized membrane protein
MTTSKVPPNTKREVQPKGRSWFDWPAVFGLFGAAYALAIRVLTSWMWNGRNDGPLFFISPLVVLFMAVTPVPVGLLIYVSERQRRGRVLLSQCLLLLAGIALPFVAFLSYVNRWFIYYSSIKFGF